MFNVTVFCASSPHGESEARYLALAREFGQLLAEEGYGCVNGGSTGMMQALCEGAFRSGGRVEIVNLEAYPPEHQAYHKLEFRKELPERQGLLIEKGDAYVALPGGAGTTYEVLEVLARTTLGELKNKPLICVGKEWSLLAKLLDQQVKLGLTRHHYGSFIAFVPDISSAVRKLNTHFKYRARVES